MHNHLQRIMRLVRRTGDRVIVTDANNPDDSFVLMSFDDYELLIEDRFGSGEDEWLPETAGSDGEDIPEIEMDDWREEGEEGEDEEEKDEREPAAAIEDEGAWRGEIPPEAYAGDAEEDEEEDEEETLDNGQGYGTIRTASQNRPEKRKNWQIPPEIKRGSIAVEEDRYYLENI